MIYQHRLVIARGGRLIKRHEAFQKEALGSLEEHGSVLIGAWEIWIGPETGCGVYQIRQHESLASWEQHRESVHRDVALNERYRSNLSPINDFVDTAIVKRVDESPQLPTVWGTVDEVRGKPRGFYEQRILYFRPGTAAAHHRVYFEQVAPALEREGATLKGFFDTVIGPGTTNTGSHRSIELRRFPDMASWQRWRQVQESDPELAKLIKETWLSNVERVESVLLFPLDYSRMR